MYQLSLHAQSVAKVIINRRRLGRRRWGGVRISCRDRGYFFHLFLSYFSGNLGIFLEISSPLQYSRICARRVRGQTARVKLTTRLRQRRPRVPMRRRPPPRAARIRRVTACGPQSMGHRSLVSRSSVSRSSVSWSKHSLHSGVN